MKKISRNTLIVFVLTIFIFSCEPNQDKEAADQNNIPEKSETVDSEEKEIRATLDKVLVAVGNRDVQTLKNLTFDNAKIAWTFLKDDEWQSKGISIEDYLNNISENENPIPISEIASRYEISITVGRLANVIAPTTISQFGIAKTYEVNHFTLMKDIDQWKIVSVAWTVHRIPEEKREFDLDLFAQNYAQVWSSNKPVFVSMFYEEEGSLLVNNGEPAIGRNAISDVAQSFMTRFPDMEVSFDSLVHGDQRIEFHWTLTGTDSDPNGKGHKVKFSGFELWTMGENDLIKESKGSFSSEEYQRQLEFGISSSSE